MADHYECRGTVDCDPMLPHCANCGNDWPCKWSAEDAKPDATSLGEVTSPKPFMIAGAVRASSIEPTDLTFYFAEPTAGNVSAIEINGHRYELDEIDFYERDAKGVYHHVPKGAREHVALAPELTIDGLALTPAEDDEPGLEVP